jgi:tetratricopeptide (TPR) repeat protein
LEEQALAARYPDATLADVFLNAQFHALAGRPRPALERLGVVIDAADAPQPLRLAALRLRARIRLWEHAFGDALEDLRTLRVMTGVDAESAMGRVLSFDLETHTHALWRHIRFAGKSAYEDAKRWADRTEVLLHVKGGRDALARERARLVGDSCRTLAEAARLVEAGLFAEAAAALADAQTDDPADARAPLMLGFVYLHGWSDFTRALPAFHAALRLDERLAPAWLGRAMALAKSRDRRGALAAADRAIAADPTLAAGYAWRALILRLAFRRYADALAAIDKAIDLDATDPVLRLERAVILIGRRQHADALASVEQSLALDGDIRLAHDLRAGLLCGLGLRGDWYRTGNSMERYEEALEAFRQSLECNPLHPATWLRLAQVQRVCGFLGESIDSADRALDLDPTGIDARWQKIRAMTGAQRFEEALREVACLQRTRPGSSHSWRAICLARLGKMEEAAVALLREQSLTYMPRHAQCLELLGRHAEALELAQTETRDRGWCVHRVRLLRAAGRHAEARELAARRLGGYTRRESRVAAAYLHAVAGHAERARELLAGYDLPWTPDLLYEAARAEAVLGDREATLRRLERAADAGLRLPLNAAPDAEFAALVEDPRYRELLTRFARN